MLSIKEIKKPISNEMNVFEDKFKTSLKTRVPLLDKIMHYIIKRKYPSLPYFASNKNERYEEIKLHDNTIVKKYTTPFI